MSTKPYGKPGWIAFTTTMRPDQWERFWKIADREERTFNQILRDLLALGFLVYDELHDRLDSADRMGTVCASKVVAERLLENARGGRTARPRKRR